MKLPESIQEEMKQYKNVVWDESEDHFHITDGDECWMEISPKYYPPGKHYDEDRFKALNKAWNMVKVNATGRDEE